MSGAPITWGGHAIEHALMHRRCQPREDGNSIYLEKHGPEIKMPKLYQHFAQVLFKPTTGQQDAAKVASPGRVGMLVGYGTLPGGAWDGTYKCVDLRDFQVDACRSHARIWITKSIQYPKGPPTFPLAAAKAESQKEQLADRYRQGAAEQIDPGSESEDDESEDEEMKAINAKQRKERKNAASSSSGAIHEPDFSDDENVSADNIGTVFVGQNATLPKSTPEGERGPKPNRGSKRPADIHTAVWSAVSQGPGDRELETRRRECAGEEPPEISNEVIQLLPEIMRMQVATAFARRDKLRAENSPSSVDNKEVRKEQKLRRATINR